MRTHQWSQYLNARLKKEAAIVSGSFFAVTAALAQSTAAPYVARAELKDLSFQVVDLRPDDGIAASFAPLGEKNNEFSGFAEVFWSVAPLRTNYFEKESDYASGEWDDSLLGGGDLHVSLENNQATASRQGGSIVAELAVQSSSFTDPDIPRTLITLIGDLPRFALSSRVIPAQPAWVLSPGSEVHIFGTTDISVDWSMDKIENVPSGWVATTTSTYTYAYVNLYETDFSNDAFEGLKRSHNTSINISYSAYVNEHKVESFQLTARNRSEVPMYLGMDMVAQAGATFMAGNLGMVPEPSALTLILAGMGSVGWRWRRLRRAAQVPTGPERV